MNKVNTLKEVLDTILSNLALADRRYLKDTKEDDLIQFHSNFGMMIRNRFLLWQGNPELLTDMGLSKGTHPDEVSQKIIEALWKRLQNEP